MTQKIIKQISTLYYRASPQTIEQDVIKAIDLLKLLPDEQARAKAAVFMDGLSQMRSEWRLETNKLRLKKRNKSKTSKRPSKTKASNTRQERNTRK